jgi:hypothetical protein
MAGLWIYDLRLTVDDWQLAIGDLRFAIED